MIEVEKSEKFQAEDGADALVAALKKITVASLMDRAFKAGANGTSLIVGVSREGDSEAEQIETALEKPMVGVFLTTNPELIRKLHAMVEASLAEKKCETCNDLTCAKKRRLN